MAKAVSYATTFVFAGLRFAGDQPARFRQVTMFRGPVSLDVAWDVEE